MDILPSFESFSAGYRRGQPQVVWASLVSDLETPISAYLKLSGGAPFSFLLESVVSGTVKDRYSFIGIEPDLIWQCARDKVTVIHDPADKNAALTFTAPNALDSLRALLQQSRIDLPPGFPPIPISAGLFGYLGYDMVRMMERIPDTRPDTLNVPDAIMMRPSLIVAFDSIENRMTLMAPAYPRKDVADHAAYQNACDRLLNGVKKMAQRLVLDGDKAESGAPAKASEPQSNTSPEQFCKMVERAKDYIHAGDAFQVVLSQRFAVPFAAPPFTLYRSLRRLNPSPFLFYLNFGGFQLVGSSPEILVRLREGKVTIRPIAGTRPRHQSNRTDAELAADLLADPKERAEHLMLLDLGRNDVGRVAKTGTVKVTESFNIELYSHVMHIVSNVEGQIDPKYDALDALFAGFPAGTVSGAPKVRAMQIIDELEVSRRGPYGGCIGYLGANGTLDTCIALRTALVKDGTMYVQAGGGVVADSDPMYEYNESCAKAKALIRAAEDALRS